MFACYSRTHPKHNYIPFSSYKSDVAMSVPPPIPPTTTLLSDHRKQEVCGGIFWGGLILHTAGCSCRRKDIAFSFGRNRIDFKQTPAGSLLLPTAAPNRSRRENLESPSTSLVLLHRFQEKKKSESSIR